MSSSRGVGARSKQPSSRTSSVVRSSGGGTGGAPPGRGPVRAPSTSSRVTTTNSTTSTQKHCPSPYLELQQELQRSLHAEYVLIVYGKDPSQEDSNRSVKQPPSYVMLAEPVPVKLSHQVFMQLSFNVLKQRLLNVSAASPSSSSPLPETSCALSSRQKDVLALFTFLKTFGAQINAAKRSVQPNSPPLVSVQHLRFQLLLEYGMDVQALLEHAKRSGGGGLESYFREELIPQGCSEEEFYMALGRPSGMAQECCFM